MTNNSKALVVLSGGQDSTTCLFWACNRFEEVHAITYYYGQRHDIELESAKKVFSLAKEKYPEKVKTHEFLDVEEAIKDNSAMTDTNQRLNEYDVDEVGAIAGIQTTYVPGRNILFLTIAANRAWKLGARNLVTGICQDENGGYPDVTASFAQAMQTVLTAGMGDAFYVHTPLMHLSKAESVDLALSIPGCYYALAFTTTAYSGEFPPKTRDHATVLREKGFVEAGVPDPLYIRARKEHPDFVLPQTVNYMKYKDKIDNITLKEFCTYLETNNGNSTC